MQEDQYHEFKATFPHPDAFCDGITSFANSHGGDLILGIE
ncbi:helix-turn-helix domain-containing protein [Paenibacillus sp. GCM10027629]